MLAPLSILVVIYSPYFSSAATKRVQDRANSHDLHIGSAYFFCSFTDQQSQDPQNVLGSILAQLCDTNPTFWKDVEERYRKKNPHFQHQPQRLEAYELENLILQCSENITRTFLFVDALNESKQSSKIFQILLQVIQKSTSIQIMVSSTEELSAGLGSIPATIVTVKQEELAGDIGRYINTHLQHDELRDLTAVLKETIGSTLQKRAQGRHVTGFSERFPATMLTAK